MAPFFCPAGLVRSRFTPLHVESPRRGPLWYLIHRGRLRRSSRMSRTNIVLRPLTILELERAVIARLRRVYPAACVTAVRLATTLPLRVTVSCARLYR